MARQCGNIKFTGTVDGICFYRMNDLFYARRKSGLTGEQFWRNSSFVGSRKSAERLALASKLASAVYRTTPLKKEGYASFCRLKSKAIELIKQGFAAKDIKLILVRSFVKRRKSKSIKINHQILQRINNCKLDYPIYSRVSDRQILKPFRPVCIAESKGSAGPLENCKKKNSRALATD